MWHVTPEREKERKKEPPKIKRQHLKIRKQTEEVTALPVKGKGKKLLESSQIIRSPRKTFKDISSETKRR